MTKYVVSVAAFLLVGCGHMPTTDVESTESDQYSLATPVAPEQIEDQTINTK